MCLDDVGGDGHSVVRESCVPRVRDVIKEVVNWSLAGGGMLGDEAQERRHGEAAVPQLLLLVQGKDLRPLPADNSSTGRQEGSVASSEQVHSMLLAG